MSSRLFDVVPLLRFPLLVASTIGLILASVSVDVSSGWRWSDDEIHRIMCALLSFYAVSMTSTAVFVYMDHRRGGIKLAQGRAAAQSLIRACIDAGSAVELLTLHVLVSVYAGDSGDTVLHMYAGIGALPASIFHGVLALHGLIQAVRSWQLTKNYCPTCNQRLRRCHSPDLHGTVEEGESSLRGEHKAEESPNASGKGSMEGDRLIVPAGDEA